jgi:DNA-binding IclR family transcriptional regulator
MAPPIATKVGTLEPWQLRVIDQVFDLCSPGLEIPDIRSLCAPFLRRLHEITGETVMLSIAVGHNSVVVDGIEGRGPLLSRVTHGRPIPLHAGPGSRALLSFRPDEEIHRYIESRSPLARVTPTTIVDPDALWAEVRLVRERGYALGYRDNLSGVTGVAFTCFRCEWDVSRAPSRSVVRRTSSLNRAEAVTTAQRWRLFVFRECARVLKPGGRKFSGKSSKSPS